MNKEKILTLAKKLKALSDRGVGGEKESATRILLRFCDKHGISLEEITGEEEVSDHEVWLEKEPSKEISFFVQVCSSVLGKDFKVGIYKRNYKKGQKYSGKKRCFVTCTPSQLLEIKAKHDFFWKHYQEEVEIFYSAFIQTQRLFAKSDPNDKSDEKPLTDEEKEELYKIMNMMQGMDRKVFNKQLEA